MSLCTTNSYSATKEQEAVSRIAKAAYFTVHGSTECMTTHGMFHSKITAAQCKTHATVFPRTNYDHLPITFFNSEGSYLATHVFDHLKNSDNLNQVRQHAQNLLDPVYKPVATMVMVRSRQPQDPHLNALYRTEFEFLTAMQVCVLRMQYCFSPELNTRETEAKIIKEAVASSDMRKHIVFAPWLVVKPQSYS